MIVVCPKCEGPFAVEDGAVAPLVQVACPSCAFRMILDFAAANDASLVEPGMGATVGYRTEVEYRTAVAGGVAARGVAGIRSAAMRKGPEPVAQPPRRAAPSPPPAEPARESPSGKPPRDVPTARTAPEDEKSPPAEPEPPPRPRAGVPRPRPATATEARPAAVGDREREARPAAADREREARPATAEETPASPEPPQPVPRTTEPPDRPPAAAATEEAGPPPAAPSTPPAAAAAASVEAPVAEPGSQPIEFGSPPAIKPGPAPVGPPPSPGPADPPPVELGFGAFVLALLVFLSAGIVAASYVLHGTVDPRPLLEELYHRYAGP